MIFNRQIISLVTKKSLFTVIHALIYLSLMFKEICSDSTGLQTAQYSNRRGYPFR